MINSTFSLSRFHLFNTLSHDEFWVLLKILSPIKKKEEIEDYLFTRNDRGEEESMAKKAVITERERRFLEDENENERTREKMRGG